MIWTFLSEIWLISEVGWITWNIWTWLMTCRRRYWICSLIWVFMLIFAKKFGMLMTWAVLWTVLSKFSGWCWDGWRSLSRCFLLSIHIYYYRANSLSWNLFYAWGEETDSFNPNDLGGIYVFRIRLADSGVSRKIRNVKSKVSDIFKDPWLNCKLHRHFSRKTAILIVVSLETLSQYMIFHYKWFCHYWGFTIIFELYD